MGFRILLALSFVAVLLLGGESIQYNITNNCPTTIWPATATFHGPQQPLTGFTLSPRTSRIIQSGRPWVGRIWARTGCTNNGRYFKCSTGDCGRVTITCNGSSPARPATVVDFNIGNIGVGDVYSINPTNGFNLPIRVIPQAIACPTISCYNSALCSLGGTFTCPTGPNYVIIFCP